MERWHTDVFRTMRLPRVVPQWWVHSVRHGPHAQDVQHQEGALPELRPLGDGGGPCRSRFLVVLAPWGRGCCAW